MSLTAAKDDLIRQLRTEMNWSHQIVDEYAAYENLPAILVYSEGEGASLDFAGTIRKWRLVAELRTHAGNPDAIEYHRDAANQNSLAGALDRAEFCGTLVDIETSVGAEMIETDQGDKPQYLWVQCAGDLYVTSDPTAPVGLSAVFPAAVAVTWLNNITPANISGGGQSAQDPYTYDEQRGSQDTSLSIDPEQFFNINGDGNIEWALVGTQRENGTLVTGGAVAILNTAGDRVVVASSVVDNRSLKDTPLGLIFLATNSADRSQTASSVFWVEVAS